MLWSVVLWGSTLLTVGRSVNLGGWLVTERRLPLYLFAFNSFKGIGGFKALHDGRVLKTDNTPG